MTKKAKRAKKRAPQSLTRKQRSRLEKERRTERLLIGGVVAVGVVVVGVLGYGFVDEKVIKAREPVAIVDDAPITTAEFQARVRFSRMRLRNELEYLRRQQQALDPTDPNAQFYLEYIQGNIRDLEGQLSAVNAPVIGEQVLEELIQEELVVREAERRGLAVAPEELQREIELFFGYDRNPTTPTPAPTEAVPLTAMEVLTPTPTAEPLPTPTPMTEAHFYEQYDAFLSQSLKPLGISEQQFRSWVEASLSLEKLSEQIRAEIPPEADQVKLRYLAVDSEERADELAIRLDDGEDFQALANELQEDEEVSGFGTELGWYPKSVLEERMTTELADLAFSLKVGEQSVLSEDGTRYIVEVVGREMRELDEPVLRQLTEEAFQKWLDAQQDRVERRTYEDRVPTDP